MDAITREEMYLANIAGEEETLPDPTTRVEKYLYQIASGEDTMILTPVTRIEKYLYKIATEGGGSSVPAAAGVSF